MFDFWSLGFVWAGHRLRRSIHSLGCRTWQAEAVLERKPWVNGWIIYVEFKGNVILFIGNHGFFNSETMFPADFPGSPTNRARLGRFPQEGPKLSWADFVVRWYFWGPHFGQSDILGAHLTWFDHIFFGELWHIPILFPSLALWSLGHTAFSNDQVPGKHPLNQWAAGTSKSLKWCRPSDPRPWVKQNPSGTATVIQEII